jgi:hypothetical protein
VDEGWDAAAEQAQGRAGCKRANIIGRALEDFMVGDATKMFVRAALDAARILAQTRVLPYRCDSADQHRRFEMVISPMGDGCVQVEHRLVFAEPRGLRKPSSRARALVGLRCSQCLSVRIGGRTEWADAELEPGTMLAQDICPRCAGRLFQATPAA